MKNILLIVLFFTTINGYSQNYGTIYNQVSKLSIGYSAEQRDHYFLKEKINDTGAVEMNFNGWAPSVSYTHSFLFGNVIGLDANIGFQYMNLDYGTQNYGGSFVYTSIAPTITVLQRVSFEYYMKLKVGGVFYFHHPNIIPEPARRFFPDKVGLFTGVTLGGFNFLFGNNLGMNVEISVWSPEFITCGLTYRFHGKSLKGLKGR